METRTMISSTVALVLILCAYTSATVIVNKNAGNPVELLILHNNDMHARFEQTSALSSTCNPSDAQGQRCFGGFARVATMVKKARAEAASGSGPPVLYLNAGDTYTGTVWFTVYKWEIAAAFINMLKPDAVSLGNHEFDNGVSGLTPFIENLTCPVLAANLNLRNEPTLENEKNLMNSYVFTINNTKVGVIGYLTPDTKFLVMPNNVEYENEIPAITREAEKLKADSINILIALGHSGFETDKKIANEVPDIDLVIGGHTNTFLWNGEELSNEKKQGPYPTVIKQKSGKMVPVVQAYAYTKYLGKLHVKFDANGDLIEHNGQPILLDHSVEQDKEVLDLLTKYRPGVEELAKQVAGTTKVLLGGSQSVCRLEECNIGNFLADAMIHSYVLEYTGPGWTDAPIAIIQGGGIRSSVAIGNITRADIMTVLPFDNAIVAVTITGKKLRDALERSVLRYDPIEAPGSFLQYSGIIVEYNLDRMAGTRLMSVLVRCGDCMVPTYSELEDDKHYKVLIPEFLYGGGDGYTMFQSDSKGDILTFNDVESVVTYLKNRSPIYPEVGGRIMLMKGAGAILSSSFISIIISAILIRLFN